MTKASDLSSSLPLGVVSFLTGGVILMEEILSAGWMAPEFGSGMDVWACVLGLTLFAMALGYFAGSYTSRKIEFYHLPCLICVAGVFLLLSTFVFARWISPEDNLSIFPIIIKAALLLGPPIFFLSMISPWLIELYSRTGCSAGKAAGLLYSISTLGGVAGALLSGFWWIPDWGLSQTTLFSAWLLVIAIFNCSGEKNSRWPAYISTGILGAFTLLFYFTAAKPPSLSAQNPDLKRLFIQDGWYGRKEVYEDFSRRHLMVNGILQTGAPIAGIESYQRGALLRSGYMMELLPYFYPKGRKCLVIGLGGGLLSTYFMKYGLEISSVEIDPAVVFLARKYFGFRGKCTLLDGRRFLKVTREKYDFIILDVYRGEDIPAHLCTHEFFQLLASRLAPQGVLAMNLIGSFQGTDSGSIFKTLQKTFPHLLIYPPPEGQKIGLMTLFAGTHSLSTEFAERTLKKMEISLPPPANLSSIDMKLYYILTDDQNPLSLFRRETAKEWRKISQKNYSGGI